MPSLSLCADQPPVGLLKKGLTMPHQLEVEAIVPHAERGLPGFGKFLLMEVDECIAMVGHVSRHHAVGQLTSSQSEPYLAAMAGTMSRYQHRSSHRCCGACSRFNCSVKLSSATADSVSRRGTAHLPRSVVTYICRQNRLSRLCNIGLEDDPTAAVLGRLSYGSRVADAPVKFSVARLKGWHSFVFARARYSKTSLIKYLVLQLYTSPPDVGPLLFDPKGEYALSDAHGQPGLVNVPGLAERISLYTNRRVGPNLQAFARAKCTWTSAIFHHSTSWRVRASGKTGNGFTQLVADSGLGRLETTCPIARQ